MHNINKNKSNQRKKIRLNLKKLSTTRRGIDRARKREYWSSKLKNVAIFIIHIEKIRLLKWVIIMLK